MGKFSSNDYIEMSKYLDPREFLGGKKNSGQGSHGFQPSVTEYGRKRKSQAIREEYVWMINWKHVRGFINFHFPKWRLDLRERKRAERWVFIIQNYFRMNGSAREVADCLFGRIVNGSFVPASEQKVRRIERDIQEIRLAVHGKRKDGKDHSYGKPGRPALESPKVDGFDNQTIFHGFESQWIKLISAKERADAQTVQKTAA